MEQPRGDQRIGRHQTFTFGQESGGDNVGEQRALKADFK
jgi:hypothetical protein